MPNAQFSAHPATAAGGADGGGVLGASAAAGLLVCRGGVQAAGPIACGAWRGSMAGDGFCGDTHNVTGASVVTLSVPSHMAGVVVLPAAHRRLETLGGCKTATL